MRIAGFGWENLMRQNALRGVFLWKVWLSHNVISMRISAFFLFGIIIFTSLSASGTPKIGALNGSVTLKAGYSEKGILQPPPDQMFFAMYPIKVSSGFSSKLLRSGLKNIQYESLGTLRTLQIFPRKLPMRLPKNISKIRSPSDRKAVFIMTTLPLILYANELILKDRVQIENLRSKIAGGISLGRQEKNFLTNQATKLGLKKLNFGTLLKHVDIIPPSLAIAQSAEESGWGTSRFAREGNALFGQRTWKKGKGIVPKKRAIGKKYKVRSFEHLIDGVHSYARNLNGHFAYKIFRAKRANLRKNGLRIDGLSLADTLFSYSERGDDYIQTIKRIIVENRLAVFDYARLRNSSATFNSAPDA